MVSRNTNQKMHALMSKSIFSLAINPFALFTDLGAVFLHEITPCIYSDSLPEMLHGSREVPIFIPKYHVVFIFRGTIL